MQSYYITLGQCAIRRADLAMWLFTGATRTKDVPKQIVQLAGRRPIQERCDLRDRSEHRRADGDVFGLGHRDASRNSGAKILVDDPDRSKPQVSPNFMVVHRRAQILGVPVLP